MVAAGTGVPLGDPCLRAPSRIRVSNWVRRSVGWRGQRGAHPAPAAHHAIACLSGDDDVAFDGIDLDAALLEPAHAPLERALVGLHLQGHPSVIRLDRKSV